MGWFEYNEEPKDEADKVSVTDAVLKVHQFKFRGIIYECIGDDMDFQILQFNHIINTSDWTTMENRIINQLLFGPRIKKIN